MKLWKALTNSLTNLLAVLDNITQGTAQQTARTTKKTVGNCGIGHGEATLAKGLLRRKRRNTKVSWRERDLAHFETRYLVRD